MRTIVDMGFYVRLVRFKYIFQSGVMDGMDMQTYLNPNDIHDNNNMVGVASLLYLSRATDAGIFASSDLFFFFLGWNRKLRSNPLKI